ncbi:MAG: glycosyltransferase [Acidimicrobiia bacterium]|nr:glycosyltransferase [Acidimicrobiia bacterium]
MTSSPRIAFLHLAFEDYSAAIANELASIVDLTVFTPEPLRERMALRLGDHVRLEAFAKPRFRDPRNIRTTPSLLRRLREFDLVHVQQTGDPWVDLGLSTLRMPKVVTVHDVHPHTGDGDRIPGSYPARRVMHKTAAGFIVHTDEMRAELREQVGDAPISVIDLPAMRSVWIGDRSPKVKPTNRHDVLFFGRIWTYKGLDILVKAMHVVREHVPDARLVVAGRGADLESVFVGTVPDWVALHNRFIDHDEIATFFEDAAVVALPYRDATQSAVGVMAIDFLRPAVSSAVGGLRQLFAGDSGGRLVQPESVEELAEALVELLSDDQLYVESQEQLATTFERLSPRGVAEKTAGFYDEVLAHAP